MLPIARHHAHYVFAVLQSGLTTLVASGVARASSLGDDRFLSGWLSAWLVAWALMIPVVVLAAPSLRRLAVALTQAEPDPARDRPAIPARARQAQKARTGFRRAGQGAVPEPSGQGSNH